MADYGSLIELLGHRLGLDPESIGLTSLTHSIDEACQMLNVSGPDALLARVRSEQTAWLQLVDQIVIPETWWLRIPEQYDDARRWLRQMSTDRWPLRLLSLPCATGEEAYSLAAYLLDEGFPAGSFEVTGIDVSPRAIAAAERAIYARSSWRGGKPIPHWFAEVGADLRLHERIRAHVRFRVGNALDPDLFAPGQQYELVFCRNLLIYLDRDARSRLLGTLRGALADDGMLCTGQAESLAPFADLYMPAAGFGPLSYVHRRGEPSVKPGPAAAHALPPARPTDSRWPERQLAISPCAPVSAAPTPALLAPAAAASPPSLLEIQRLADRGGTVAARHALMRLLDADAECAQAWLLLGLIELADNALEHAAEAFARASYLEPGNLEATRHQAALAERRGQSTEARQLRARLSRMGGAVT